MIKVRVVNESEVQRGITDFGKEVKNDSKQLLDALADEVVKEAKKTVPVDTGYLKRNIRKQKEGESVSVIADTDYAMYVEFGSSKNQSKPFLYPALNKVISRIDKIAKKIFK